MIFLNYSDVLAGNGNSFFFFFFFISFQQLFSCAPGDEVKRDLDCFRGAFTDTQKMEFV